MITFDQIQLLEKKVSDAVQLIKTLKNENGELRMEIDLLKEQVAELESRNTSLTSEQEEIERSFMGALTQFDELVDGESESQEEASETISASEETEIAQPEDAVVEIEEEETADDESAEETIEVSLTAETDSPAEETIDEEAAESDESGNHSEQLEIESEDPQDEAPAEEESQAAVESSVEDEKDSELEETPSKAEEEKNSGYPQNLEIF